MTEMRPIRPAGSLLERAAQAYDFGSAFRPAPVFDADPPHVEPAVETEVNAHPFEAEADHAPKAEAVAEAIATPRPAIAPTTPRTDVAPGGVAIDRERLAANGLLVPGAPVGALAEEFRHVKRHLLNTARTIRGDMGDRSRMVLVCSASPGDGKTYCAINLALSLAAERDTDVLLVDADFAKPDVLARLGLEDRPGLLDALGDPDARIEDYVVPTDVPQLSLLPAGTPSTHDTELLASERTRALLDTLMAADPRRIIIFDSPPVLAASPAATLAHHVGQVMLVVRADRTNEADLRHAVALLDGCDQLQLVLNAVSFAHGGQRYGTYYGQENQA